MLKPVARTENLIAEEIWDEVVVYDQTDNLVHRLNASAAIVWRPFTCSVDPRQRPRSGAASKQAGRLRARPG